MPRRWRWISLVLAACTVALIVSLWSPRASSRASPAAASAPSVASQTVATGDPPPPELAMTRDEAPAPAAAAVVPAPVKPASAPTKAPDLAARERVKFHVTNVRGFPVADAEIELTGMRTQRERGSWHSWRIEVQLGKTDAQGWLELVYPPWVDIDSEIGELTFRVTHPDYATLDDQGRKVEPVIEVELATGSVLVVSGWIGERSHVITDVEAEFSWDVDIKPQDWLPRRDGRLTTTRVPAGAHLLYLRHESGEHELFFSAMTEFTLAAGETAELHLELVPARHVVGRLDEVVPRPVIDGHLVLAAQKGTRGRSGTLLRTFVVPVQADGSFTIDGVMIGDAQVVALCKGWASKMQQLTHDDLDSAGESDKTELFAQLVDLRGGGELVVAMEPTAAFEIELHAPDGSPLTGARVNAWPNACWRIGACGMYIEDRFWIGVTDQHGRTRIDDIPAGEHMFGIQHDIYDFPLDPPASPTGHRHRQERFAAGETLQRSYTLERKSKE